MCLVFCFFYCEVEWTNQLLLLRELLQLLCLQYITHITHVIQLGYTGDLFLYFIYVIFHTYCTINVGVGDDCGWFTLEQNRLTNAEHSPSHTAHSRRDILYKMYDTSTRHNYWPAFMLSWEVVTLAQPFCLSVSISGDRWLLGSGIKTCRHVLLRDSPTYTGSEAFRTRFRLKQNCCCTIC